MNLAKVPSFCIYSRVQRLDQSYASLWLVMFVYAQSLLHATALIDINTIVQPFFGLCPVSGAGALPEVEDVQIMTAVNNPGYNVEYGSVADLVDGSFIINGNAAAGYSGSTDPLYYQGTMTLGQVLTDTSLGNLTLPVSKLQVQNTVCSQNPNVACSMIYVNGLTNVSADIYGQLIYTDRVPVFFNQAPPTPLSTIVTQRALGVLVNPTASSILARVASLNSGFNIAMATVQGIGLLGATLVSVPSQHVTGNVAVSYLL